MNIIGRPKVDKLYRSKNVQIRMDPVAIDILEEFGKGSKKNFIEDILFLLKNTYTTDKESLLKFIGPVLYQKYFKN